MITSRVSASSIPVRRLGYGGTGSGPSDELFHRAGLPQIKRKKLAVIVVALEKVHLVRMGDLPLNGFQKDLVRQVTALG